MKKKGFTLIELIVVIAIIGVLAAILVPALLGYVRKSKITTANTTAKSIYNALNTSLVDMDSDGDPIPSSKTYSGNGLTAITDNTLKTKVASYFSDIKKVSEWTASIDATGNCDGVAAKNGKYIGTYPLQMTVEKFSSGGTWTTAQGLAYAKS